jgi:hypothetical protein
MNQPQGSLFFIALLPPPEVQEIATKIKLEFAETAILILKTKEDKVLYVNKRTSV